MRLDDFARPFRIEQVGVARGRLLGFDHGGVVADDAEPDAEAGEGSVGVLVLGRIVLGYVLGHIRLEHSFAFPHDEVGGVGRIDDVDRMNAARIFLADALEHALGAGSLHAHGDAGICRLERFGDALGDRQIDGGVVYDPALFLRRFDQLRRHRARRRRRRGDRGEGARCREGGRAPEHVSPGKLRHYRLLTEIVIVVHPLKTRQRSGGR